MEQPEPDPQEDEPDAVLQRKIQNMRTKLSMAKEMLEELLAERDELDRTHSEELTRLDDTLANGRRERDRLKLQVADVKAELHSVEVQAADDAAAFDQELAKVKMEEAALREMIAAEKEKHRGVKDRLRELSAAQRAAKPTEPVVYTTSSTVEDTTSPEPAAPAKQFAQACDQAAENLAAIFEASPIPPTPPISGSTPGFHTPLSAIRKSGGRSKRKNRVSFGVVAIRDYEVEIGGGGGVPLEGSPLGLGWNFQPKEPVGLEQWEEQREPRRIHKEVFMRQGYIPPEKRREKLLAMGFEDEDVERGAEDTREVQALRKESVDELTDDEQVPVLANAFMWWWMVSQGLDSYLDE